MSTSESSTRPVPDGYRTASPYLIAANAGAALEFYPTAFDTLYARALAAGATSLRPMADQPFGDRSGTIRDPFGHRWTLITQIEDISDAEIERRFALMMGGDKSRGAADGGTT